MSERCSEKINSSFISNDFLDKSIEIKSLGSGTFGRVALYDTPLGQLVIKETKIDHKSLGYPSDFLTEIDMLFKLRPVKTVVTIEGVFFDKDRRKGYVLLEPLDCNLSQWYSNNTFDFRISQLLNIITMVGGAIATMHYFSFVHNDLKPNNMLVKESGEMIFKLADLGTAAYIKDTNVHYCGIEQYKPPKIKNIFHSEFWAFMVSLVEVIIGKRLVNIKKDESCNLFYNLYTKNNKFDLSTYLKSVLTKQQYDKIPTKFWIFVDDLINDRETNIIDALDKIGINMNQDLLNQVDKCISKEVPNQKRFRMIESEYRQKFINVGLSARHFDRFVRLYNKFLDTVPSTQHLSSIDFKYYAEVAFIIIARNKATKFDYFTDQEEFLLFERAFLTLIQYQTVIC